MKLKVLWEEIPESKRYGKVFRLRNKGTEVWRLNLAEFVTGSRQFEISGGRYAHKEFFPENVQTDEAKKAFIQNLFGVDE